METISVREFSKLTRIKECQVRDLTFAKTFPLHPHWRESAYL